MVEHRWEFLIEADQGDVYLVHKCVRCGTRFPIVYDPNSKNFKWDSFSVSPDCDTQILKRVLLL